ncbi:cyclase [Sphingomonas spermidinifaciens]|uniref:Cyclase n=1 Tax=Sphingomonas spermidinifaciens TaxID=1141889 RepID=A0A2A4B807_9SPHN|nr:SRPBCC family protein [Sphingomonas spermidinifaciens]PCD03909.1 cyclase [Sphingomonas spermidinifaciens]
MKAPKPRTALAIGAAAIGLLALARSSARDAPAATGDAPGRTARRERFGRYRVVGKTVTVAKPSRAELFDFWRDFTNLPAFMENLNAVRPLSEGRWEWEIVAPGETSVTVVTEIASERAGELIAWRSVEGSRIDTEGRVAFRDAPGGRGTQVELVVAYVPPAGQAGVAIAKLLQREPAQQARRDLRRFKALMETGEIPTSDNRIETEKA